MREDTAREVVMQRWLEELKLQHFMPVLLLGIDINDAEHTGLFIMEGVDDRAAAAVLHELSLRMQKEADAND